MTLSMMIMAFTATTQVLNLPPGLLDAMCYVESNHNPSAYVHSDGGSPSIGACQLKLETAKFIGYRGDAEGLRDPFTNIFYSGLYLRYQLDRYKGNVARGVTAYNKGKSDGNGNSKYYRKVKAIWKDHK